MGVLLNPDSSVTAASSSSASRAHPGNDKKKAMINTHYGETLIRNKKYVKGASNVRASRHQNDPPHQNQPCHPCPHRQHPHPMTKVNIKVRYS